MKAHLKIKSRRYLDKIWGYHVHYMCVTIKI
jgi:hypothetical protein